jgi:hypothetical protein
MSDELSVPDRWTADDVRRWLLTLFGRNGYSELPGLSSHIAAPVAIQALFDRSRSDVQEVLKAGAVNALREWRLAAHGFGALEQLSQTTALLKATAAAPVLADIAQRQMQDHAPPEQSHAVSMVIACLCGFAPDAVVEMALRRMFYEPRVDASLAGQLFVGLCYCRPDAYPSHVPRFLALRERIPGRLSHIGSALLDAVPPLTLIERFEELDDRSRRALANILRYTPNSDLDFTFTARGVELVWIADPRTTASLAQKSARQNIQMWSEHFSEVLGNFAGADINATLLQQANREMGHRTVARES